VEGAAVAIEVCGDSLVRREFFSFGVFRILGFYRLLLAFQRSSNGLSRETVFVFAFWVMLYVLSLECQGS
jgi:hypothetical protein